MSTILQALKASTNLSSLVSETHVIDRNEFVCCPNPAHEDEHPSCHIREQSFKCFACGCSGDAIDWYELVHDCTTGEAIQTLRKRAQEAPRITSQFPRGDTTKTKSSLTLKPVSASILLTHKRRTANLSRIPRAMTGRGFTLENLCQLEFAAAGEDAVFPISGPDGSVLALKCRYSELKGVMRYGYVTKGHGSPAWCSPNFVAKFKVLIVEGELNAMICYMAAPHLAVMGVAGANGAIYTEALKGKEVYVYADGDAPGHKARERWCKQALEAGAIAVFALEP